MSVPFSNTHLRVPRGFGTILEGLAREVLRDQPEDIPAYAMRYFNALLKQREESGVDPAEWAARLEDRFYNNHAFKNTETSHEKESESEASDAEGKSHEPQTEDESSHLAEVSALSATQPDVSGKDDSTKGSDEKEKVNITERFTLAAEKECSKRNSIADVQSDEESNTDEEKDPPKTTFDQADRHNIEMDDNPVSDENISQFHSELTDLLSFREIPNEDLFSHEFEDDGDDHQGGAFVEKNIVDSEEENTEFTEAVEAVPYSGLAEVDICAAELGRTEKPLERCSAQDNTYVDEEEESLNLQLDTELSRYEISQGSQQEAEDQAQNINEGEILETEDLHEETNESSALIEKNLDDNPILKEDSLVEVSFEDVPEAHQHITEDGEETLMEDASVEILQNTELEMEQTEDSIELTTSSADQHISDTEEQLQPEMEEVKKDVLSEEEEIESHHASFDSTKEKVDTNNSNLHDSNNGEMETGAKSISSSNQPTTEAEKQIEENETDHKDTKEKSEETFYQKQVPVKEKESDDPDYERNETTDIGNEDEEEKCTVGYGEIGDREMNDGKAEENSAHATKSNLSMTRMEEEDETTEESVLHLPQENKQSPRADVDLQREDNSEEKEGAEEYIRIIVDLEVHETNEEMEKQEITSLTHSTNWTAADNEEEKGPNEYEKDATASANKSDKEECSRPQEEEDIMDIPLDDPEANRAAAKIQAGFRGHMTRKKMKPEDKTEGEEVSSTGDVLNSSQGVSETGRSGAVERDDTSVPEQ